MSNDELHRIGSSLTVEDLGELLGAFFRARNRVEDLAITATARRMDTYSVVERFASDSSSRHRRAIASASVTRTCSPVQTPSASVAPGKLA